MGKHFWDLALLAFIVFNFIFIVDVMASPDSYVTMYPSPVKCYSDDGILDFSSAYAFDTIKVTSSQLEFNATSTVSNFLGNQFVFNLVNASDDKNPKVVLITGSTKPTYILNAKNYSHSDNSITMYGLSEFKTITVSFQNNLGNNKIIQAPTMTSAPSFQGSKLRLKIESTGTSTTKIECPRKPNLVVVNGKVYKEGGVWTYTANVFTLTWTHSSPADVELDLQQWETSSFPDPLIQHLQQGNLLAFITGLYTRVLGTLFYVILILLVSVPLYIKTQSLAYLCILWILLGGVLVALVPIEGFQIGWILIIIGIAGLLYRATR